MLDIPVPIIGVTDGTLIIDILELFLPARDVVLRKLITNGSVDVALVFFIVFDEASTGRVNPNHQVLVLRLRIHFRKVSARVRKTLFHIGMLGLANVPLIFDELLERHGKLIPREFIQLLPTLLHVLVELNGSGELINLVSYFIAAGIDFLVFAGRNGMRVITQIMS